MVGLRPDSLGGDSVAGHCRIEQGSKHLTDHYRLIVDHHTKGTIEGDDYAKIPGRILSDDLDLLCVQPCRCRQRPGVSKIPEATHF